MYSKKLYSTTLLLLSTLLVGAALSHGHHTQSHSLSGDCLKRSITKLVSSGCNFSKNSKLITLLSQNGAPSQDFALGQADYGEASVLYPSPKFLRGYFKKAISNPKTSFWGELGAGIQFLGDYAAIGMDNIHLCSDQGNYADYTITHAKLIVPKSVLTGLDKDEIRNAGWQIVCENKLKVYEELLHGESLKHSVISRE